ncbi:MAG: hypothetical protein H6741_14000 [Alphaproteobacteria bacterium]|nr:hypothetical protein [Alphaproteobacteria bacterium]MCB9793827.1 hypothetical protein [Alphaproteobacteria bacterium]
MKHISYIGLASGLLALSLTLPAFAQDPQEGSEAPEPVRGKLIQGSKIEPSAPRVSAEPTGFPSAPPANAEQRQWVSTVIQQNYGGVRRCYIDGLLADDRMAGILKVRLQLGPDGVPVWGEVSLSTLDSPRVEACMLAALKGMDYSRVDTHEPFHFGHTLVFFPEAYPSAKELKLDRNLQEVQGCYAEAAKDHELRGILQVRFVANAGRAVSPSLALNTTGHEELGECVLASTERWKLSRGLSGSYTYLLRVTPEQGVTPYGLQ